MRIFRAQIRAHTEVTNLVGLLILIYEAYDMESDFLECKNGNIANIGSYLINNNNIYGLRS